MRHPNYNIRKKQILAILSYAREMTAKEITDLCFPVSLTCISSRLLSYLKQGLVKREKREKDNIFIYSITPKGLERLEWFLGSKSIKKQIDLLVKREN